MVHGGEAVRASSEDVHRTLTTSYDLWSSCADPSNVKGGLPVECVRLRNILGPTPSYLADRLVDFEPTRLKLERRLAQGNAFELFISGTSLWRTSKCEQDTGVRTLHHEILLGTQRATPCELAPDRLSEWPGVQSSESAEEGNYLAILAFAWAYLLSARWLEIQEKSALWLCPERTGGIDYCQGQAEWLLKSDNVQASAEGIEVNLGHVDDRAARWWAAILTGGEGYKATSVLDGHRYCSPWSVRLSTSKRFLLRKSDGRTPQPSSDSPPSYDQALGYLSDFCAFHGIHGQSSAALAACLHFPSLRNATITLPTSKPYGVPPAVQARFDTVHKDADFLDYYMTISCNVWGVRALLSGVFFDSRIYCNAVSPWLQPAFDVVTSVVETGQYWRLAATMARRQPKLAALWLGAIMAGGEKRILRDTHSGLYAVELHAAAWTHTVHSFIGPWPPASAPANGSVIRRIDEARLLFLTGGEGFSRVPVCPWPPFGATALESTEIEIRQHAQCIGHCLQYVSWRWESATGSATVEDRGCDINACDYQSAGSFLRAATTTMSLRSETLSELATRGIFGWIRPHGFPAEEKAIRSHEWFDLDETDEEAVDSDVGESS